MDKLYENSETGCCPRFDPAPWNGFDKLMVRNMEKIKSAGALAPEPLMFTDENSLWGADVYIAVGKVVPGAAIEKMSGTFLSKVFEGPYRDAGKWAKEMDKYVRLKGKDS